MAQLCDNETKSRTDNDREENRIIWRSEITSLKSEIILSKPTSSLL